MAQLYDLPPEYMDDLSSLWHSIVKHEPDIVEWLEYYQRMGTNKIYLFDNSDPEYNAVYNLTIPYVNSGFVQYERIYASNEFEQPQRLAYEKCHKMYKEKHQFMAFFDADEFVHIVNDTVSIPTVLKDYEQYGALGLSWLEFGSSGHIAKPANGILPNYFKCNKMNPHVKLIINLPFFSSGKFLDPHQVRLDKAYFAVNEKYQKVSSAIPITHRPSHPMLAYAVHVISYVRTVAVAVRSLLIAPSALITARSTSITMC